MQDSRLGTKEHAFELRTGVLGHEARLTALLLKLTAHGLTSLLPLLLLVRLPHSLQQLKEAPGSLQQRGLFIHDHRRALALVAMEGLVKGGLLVTDTQLLLDSILVVAEGADPICNLLPFAFIL